MVNIKEQLISVFRECGIYVDLDNLETSLEFDSITFASLIIAMENEFEIEFLPEDIKKENFKSFLSCESCIKNKLKDRSGQ